MHDDEAPLSTVCAALTTHSGPYGAAFGRWILVRGICDPGTTVGIQVRFDRFSGSTQSRRPATGQRERRERLAPRISRTEVAPLETHGDGDGDDLALDGGCAIREAGPREAHLPAVSNRLAKRLCVDNWDGLLYRDF